MTFYCRRNCDTYNGATISLFGAGEDSHKGLRGAHGSDVSPIGRLILQGEELPNGNLMPEECIHNFYTSWPHVY